MINTVEEISHRLGIRPLGKLHWSWDLKNEKRKSMSYSGKRAFSLEGMQVQSPEMRHIHETVRGPVCLGNSEQGSILGNKNRANPVSILHIIVWSLDLILNPKGSHWGFGAEEGNVLIYLGFRKITLLLMKCRRKSRWKQKGRWLHLRFRGMIGRMQELIWETASWISLMVSMWKVKEREISKYSIKLIIFLWE